MLALLADDIKTCLKWLNCIARTVFTATFTLKCMHCEVHTESAVDIDTGLTYSRVLLAAKERHKDEQHDSKKENFRQFQLHNGSRLIGMNMQ